MTAMVTAEAPAVSGTPSRGPRGLVWAMLRLHSWALRFWVLLVAVAAGLLLWAYGPGGEATRHEFAELDCGGGNGSAVTGMGCDYLGGSAFYSYELAISLAAGLLAVLPSIVAGWAGGALTGRELENGTAQLAWVQSVSPTRWLAAKLAVPAALLIPGTLLITLLHRGVWAKDAEILRIYGWYEWHDTGVFTANGLLATVHVLLGLAVGVLTGLLTRRAVPALGSAVCVQFSLMFALDQLRPRLWPARTLVTTEEYPSYDGMPVDVGSLAADGTRITDPNCYDSARCKAEHDIVAYYADYHPASHFWPLQLMETAIVLALTALAVLAAFRVLRRRTGAAV
ncbi:ABC transporter permease [Streptomyces sp. enrichment culture]|uniref:ABC transporter permease n=1 Tax=Streptomyces sp. enrichment culture TaxID=1795815 RepID=UPI003F57B518